MRVRLRVRPGDYGDIEFESFTGMMAALDGMTKSLHNTEWLATPLTEMELDLAFDAIKHLRRIFAGHREDQAQAGHEEDGDAEVSLRCRPKVTREISQFLPLL